ncbi:MAG: CoA transferase [Azospirillaceae bacterium]
MRLLAGIRVVELPDGLVDLGGRMLAELGAEVVSIVGEDAERPHARCLAWHHGKRRVTVAQGDADRLARLIAEADIVLDGRLGGMRHALGELSAANPGLVQVVAVPFGTEGARTDWPASDLTLMAMSGLMHITGDPERPPLRLPGEQAFALTGIQVATAALLGLRARRRTGRGQRIDVSAYQATTLANYREPVVYAWTGRIGRRTGNRLVRGKTGVRQIWPCADGFVTWSIIDNPGMMRSVVATMAEHGAAGELAEVDWEAILVADAPEETIARWEAPVGAFFAAHDRATLGCWSLARGWGLSVIADLDDVRASRHLAARGLFVDVADEETGRTARLPGPLFRHGADHDAPPRRLARPVRLADAGWSKR